MTLGYTRSNMLWGLKGKKLRSQGINKSILHIRTAIHRHSLGGVTSRRRRIELYECLSVKQCYCRCVLCPVPSGSPRHFTATQLNSTGVTLQWDPPLEQFQNGVIRLYELVYSDRRHHGRINVTDTSIRVGGLKPAVRYVLRVRACNDNGSGPWSSRLMISTLAAFSLA